MGRLFCVNLPFMVALRRVAAGLAVLFGTVAGTPSAPVATPWTAPLKAVVVAVPHVAFERANRSESRTTLDTEARKVQIDAADYTVPKTVVRKQAPPKKHKHKYDPFTDAPHTQAGAEQFAASLPWPWPRIVHCESLRDGSWRVDAKSWARGLFQFLPSTWRSLGGYGDPAAASWREQFRMAVKLQHRDGLRSWDCARMLGYA